MATKTNWQPGSTVCRCCFAEGCYKDISTEYFWMGKREVYSEMLLDTFDVSISYALSGPNSNSRLICEPCISRLRDATDFKRQVQECERTFMTHLNPVAVASTSVEALPESEKEELKLEQIKVEIKLDEPNYDDDDHAFQDDDDDDMDDQPLTALASKVPKKETMDLSDLLDNAKPEKLKRKIATKAKASPAKKAKKEVKPSASKAKEDDKKKKEHNYPITMARRNAQLLIENATAYPFRLPESSIVCVYCIDSFDDPEVFREHMEKEHKGFFGRLAFHHVSEGLIKVDCTKLKCRMCEEPFTTLEEVAQHLIDIHSIGLKLKFQLGAQPFILHKDKYECALCPTKLTNMCALSRHTQKHFGQFTCDTCGRTYSTASSLKHHIKLAHNPKYVGKHICRKCCKYFDSREAVREHKAVSKNCCQHICASCGERFPTWLAKQQHIKESHAIVKSYPCPECDKVFDRSDKYRAHFTIAHTTNYLSCSGCNLKFDSNYKYKRHMVTHTGEKNFKCPDCNKAFSSKSGLKQHSWMHMDVKRFRCEPCDKQFNQKVSYVTHMKAHHPDSDS